MTYLNYLACMAVSATGSFIQRVTGFGYGIFTMIFLPYIMPSYGEANILSSMISATTSIYVASGLIKRVQWKILLPPLLVSTITTYLAVQFMTAQTDSTLKLLLGIILIALSIYFFFFSSKINFKATPIKGALAGALSGVMSGLFSMGGPPMVVYFMMSCDDMNDYLATIQGYFALTGIYNVTVKATAGLISKQVLIVYVIALAAALCGTQVGKKVFDRCKPDVLKKAVYGFMALSGAANVLLTFL